MPRPSAVAPKRWRSPSRPATSSPINDASVMKPKPPSWISAMMVTCPAKDQCVAVSTVIKPVRHTADVAVNNASESALALPDADDHGAANRAVPATMTPRKPRATAIVGRRCLRRRPTLNVMLTATTLDPSSNEGKSYLPLNAPMRRHASAMSSVDPAKHSRTHS